MIYVLFYTDIFHLLNLHQLSEEDIPLQDYEIKHIEIMRRNVAECALFLKKDLSFPLKSPGKVVLVDAGQEAQQREGQAQEMLNLDIFLLVNKVLKMQVLKLFQKIGLLNIPSII
jgi:hypothetical protein